jgi:hypothetical protein
MTLAKARIVNYDRNCSFIVLATVIMTINYNCETFIVQATGCFLSKCFFFSVGFEPSALGLRVECSTTVLPPLANVSQNFQTKTCGQI